MDGWMGGWMDLKAVSRIAYSNQKDSSDISREKQTNFLLFFMLSYAQHIVVPNSFETLSETHTTQ